MPKTETQLRAEIHDYLSSIGADRTNSAVRRMAHKWKRREEEEGHAFDFFEGLRILGITSDPTPRKAIHNLSEAIA